jgi:beta-1,4-mannosyl-glycoprotein beta-1,4-N-acetylglucosaminyltransferase
MKIIDSFIFYNELDLLNYRLSILNDYVDYVILVEAKYTHSGVKKELFYENNKHLFEKFQNKIIHIILDDFPYKFPNINYEINEQWINENFHRKQIALGINKLELNNEDIIITSDLDEIINPEILMQARNNSLVFDKNGLNRLAMDMYYYNLNTLLGRGIWHGIKLLTFESYKNLNITFQDMREYEWYHHVNIIPNGGWHLSYFGNVEFIKNKIQNFAHQEFNNAKYLNDEFIMEHIHNKKDMFDHTRNIEYITTKDNNFLPPDYDKYLTKFYIE